MEDVMAVKSAHDVGRKKAKNPLDEQISFRVDKSTAKELDAQVEAAVAKQPGLILSRGDMVRMLVAEALAARAKRGK
jgi:hypothetical protein